MIVIAEFMRTDTNTYDRLQMMHWSTLCSTASNHPILLPLPPPPQLPTRPSPIDHSHLHLPHDPLPLSRFPLLDGLAPPPARFAALRDLTTRLGPPGPRGPRGISYPGHPAPLPPRPRAPADRAARHSASPQGEQAAWDRGLGQKRALGLRRHVAARSPAARSPASE